MRGILTGLLLGVIQGLTEFLPVSSSGHLAVMEHLLGRKVEQFLAFDVVVHGATLLVVLVYFGKDLSRLLPSREPLDEPWYLEITGGGGAWYFYWLVFLSLVPLLVVYPLWGEYIEALRLEPLAIGGGFIYAGAFMAGSEFLASKDRRPVLGMGWTAALLMGLAQAVALTPGISRSGMTISTGRLSGLSRDAAFRFSFFMLIPAISGALVLKARDIAGFGDWKMLAAGAAGAFVSGLAGLHLLRRVVLRMGLWIFGVYCVLIGIVTIIIRAVGVRL